MRLYIITIITKMYIEIYAFSNYFLIIEQDKEKNIEYHTSDTAFIGFTGICLGDLYLSNG